MGTKMAMLCFAVAIGLTVMGCDPPPTCDANLKHLTQVFNYAGSPWRTPIGSSPALHPDSASIISHAYEVRGDTGLHVQIYDWARPIFYVGAAQSKNTYIRGLVYNGKSSAGPVRWRSCIQGAPQGDGHCIVVDEVDGCVMDLWGLNKNAGVTDPDAYNVGALPFTDTNAMYDNPHTSSASAAMGVSGYEGLVWPDECTSTIPHAFWFCWLSGHNNPNGGWRVLPASHGDGEGTCTYDFIEGMRIQLNPSYSLTGWASYQAPIGEALKTYGMYDGNSGGNWSINGISRQPYTNNPWLGILPAGTETNSTFPVPVTINNFRVLAIPGYTTSPGRQVDTTCLTYQPGNAAFITLTGISPNSGPAAGGTAVTLTGSGFNNGTRVSFYGGGNGTNFVRVSDTMITCTTPARTNWDNVVVRVEGGSGVTSHGVNFNYGGGGTPTPTLSAIAPTSGPTAGGTACTLTGTDLTGCSSVSFGGSAAGSISVVSSTQVRCTSPAKSAGTYDVTATTAGGTSNPVSFTYTGGGGGGYTATLYSPADARVHSGSSNQNFGTITTLYVQKNANTENAAYIKWDLNSVQGSSITSAKLRLYRSGTGNATTNKVYSCATDTWTETGITWANRPAWGTQQVSYSVPAGGNWAEVDVTSYVSANFSGDKLVTMVIRDDQSLNVQVPYNSDEATSNKPQLVVISQ